MTKQPRILPPGVDSLGEDAVFGTMWIKVGTLKLIRTSNASYNVLCQFWGQATPARLSTRFDTANNQQQRTQKYDVKCPVTFFGEYLQEMKNNLRLEVQEVGKVVFDISKFLKKTINIDSRQAFDHFKGFFQVIGKGNRKAGSLQIQMGCDFDPQVAIKQLGEQAIEQIRKSQMMKCPAEKLQVKQCCGHCQCVCPKPPRKTIVTKNQVKNDDPRIPHSLDTKPRDENSYDAHRYQNNEQQNKAIKIQKPIQKQIPQLQQKPQVKVNQNVQQFPHVPQILTYSNLRLNYDDPELKQQIIKTPVDHVIQQKQRPKSPTKDVPIKKQQPLKPVNLYIGQSVQDSHYSIKAKPEISKQDLLKQFYGAENSPFKSNYQPIREKKSQQNFFDGKQPEIQKLSRVINLNKQLDNIRAPPLLPADYEGGDRSYFNDTNFKKTGKRTQSKSNLMLSLFIEINKNGVMLPSKQAFIIAYRPYGQKERLTLGPSFTDIIHILSIVGESEVKKMGKTPFIIEFWNAVTNKFIGLIKINLHKIKQGFILQDRLNEMAIKTNILPTTIQRGDLKILDLSDKQVGVCSLYAAIGTSNQLNLYLNQKQSTNIPNIQKNISIVNPGAAKIQDPQKQPNIIPNKKQVQPVSADHKNILTNYETFLEHIYRNNNKIYEELNQLMSDRSVSAEEFDHLGKSIGLQNVANIFEIHRKINNQNSQTDIDFHTVAHSFDDYVEIVQSAKQDFTTCAKVVRNLYADPISILAKVKQHAPMQVVSKKKGQQVMQKYCNYHEPVSDLYFKLNQYISIDLLSSVLTPNRAIQLNDLSQLSKQYVTELILDRVRQQINTQGINLQQVENQTANNKVSIFLLYKLLKGKISLWIIMHLGNYFAKERKQADWWENIDIKQFIQGIKPKSINNQNPLIKNTLPQKSPQKGNNEPSSSQILNNHEESMNLVNQSNNIQHDLIKQQIQQNKRPAEPVVIPAQKLQPSSIVEPTQKYFKHLFSIQPTELILDHPVRGNNCTVIYEFPFEQQQVKSKNFQTSIDKHKYSLKMYGTHGFTIAEPVQNYIADNAVKFIVKIDNKIEYEGQLPSDELLIKANTQQDKVIPLFGERAQGIAGKIKLNINYEAAPASQNILGKQTTYQLFLPKSGYVNYSITCQMQPSKLRSQLNIKQQFYVALVLDIFYNSSVLRNQFPPISSKLYSGQNELVQLGGSLKLSLGPVVLQYLKSNKAKLSLNVIYYSKQSSNFQRKQLPFAIIQLPLVSIIKAQGIKGNYAFKNKLGMFVTLADCNLKYEKQQNNKLALNRDQRDKQRGAYWIILNFLEFINFQDRKFTWIKMEFVLKGKKYATDKIQLQQYSVNFLQNAGIMIKLTEQQFVDTKMIPITILTNTSQKLAIDINLKALSKDLLHKRTAINNQNYIIVNQSSRATKMRMALKTYCFRGGPLLSNFVNALYQHLDVQVFDQMEFPQQIDNYDQMLNIFKSKLKISQKGLQEAMSELDLIKNKQKLNFEFFTNRTYYKLDFTPILAENQSDIGYICQQLPTEASKQQIMSYISDNKIKLQNFRQQFLDRFAFKELNRLRADKNVQFLGIQNQIDLISFVRKIKILDASHQQQSSYMPNESYDQKIIELTILQGTAFNQLYNGIKPNSLIRIPDIGMQTQVSHRNSNPYFNEGMQIDLDHENLTILKNMRIEVYHCTADDDDAENILIGQGYLKLSAQDLKNNNSKIIKVVLTSKMSTKMKATLNIKFAISSNKRIKRKNESSSNQIEDSVDVNRFGEIMHDIKQEMADKNRLFESSDEDEE